MKKILAVAACLLLVFAVYLTYNTVDENAPVASAIHKEMKTYSGTVYVAGMGGHFSVAEVEIDPASPKPITVKNLDRIVIGNKDTHPTHDARIDSNDKTKMYWSTYKVDKKGEGRTVHVGLSDLKTGKVLMDKAMQLPDRVAWDGALYCASGQTKDTFIPVTMTNEAFIDVLDKKDLSLKHRVYLDKEGYKDNYFFFHGTNSPDMKTFALTVNKTQAWAKPNEPGARIGQIDMLLLDLPALEQGKVKILKKNTITGSPTGTFTFRQYFTPDGKYLLQSGADRFYLLDGESLALLDEEMMQNGENHDAIGTPDGKYAVLTLRVKVPSTEEPEGKVMTDGMLQLYDIENKRVVGEPTSVCYGCHKPYGIPGNAVLCGLDANWQ
ncbi:MAG: hypothetical protein Kow0025_15400 [Thermodesulfovibrionales bacterium]